MRDIVVKLLSAFDDLIMFAQLLIDADIISLGYALYYVVEKHPIQRMEIARMLLLKGASMEVRLDPGYKTVLSQNSLFNDPELTRLLLQNGANPNSVNWQGRTALHIAVLCDNHETAMLLVRYGANVYHKDNVGITPLRISPRGRGVELLEAFEIRKIRWQRIKVFVLFRSSIYGSEVYQLAQKKLLPRNRAASRVVVFDEEGGGGEAAVKEATTNIWKVVDKVLGNLDLCKIIVAYL